VNKLKKLLKKIVLLLGFISRLLIIITIVPTTTNVNNLLNQIKVCHPKNPYSLLLVAIESRMDDEEGRWKTWVQLTFINSTQ